MKSLISCLVFFLFAAGSVSAQSDTSTFNIRVYGGADNVPPTTPTLLSVTPITTSQIDLSWSSSTDDILLNGYSILRDGFAVATTTQLSYSDVGLVASTTYSYAVRAFDLAKNYSTTSNSLSTTTLKIPPPAPADPSKESTAARVVIDELVVVAGVSTTSIIMTTARPGRLEVRWGRTGSYELGYVVSNAYSTDHSVLLTDLEPGTKYEFEIIGYTAHGFQSVVKTGSFVTNTKKVLSSPVNVSRFQATGNGADVDLSWRLPDYSLVSHVRIVRSHLGYPEHPQDGAIVYQGLKGSARDEGILAQYSPVYYTAFVYDVFGNVSSGAVAKIYAESLAGGDGLNNVEQSDNSLIDNGPVITINTERVTVDMKMPELSDITIEQGKRIYTLLNTDIVLDSERALTISVPEATVAGNLKSIIATFVDPTNNHNAYSFLLRINKDQTAYEAVIEPLRVVGESQIDVKIYDYEAFVVATYKAPVMFDVLPEAGSFYGIFPGVTFERTHIILAGIIAFPVLIFLLFFLYRRRAEDNG